MKEFMNAILTWLKESFNEMEDAAIYTADFVDGKVGPWG